MNLQTTTSPSATVREAGRDRNQDASDHRWLVLALLCTAQLLVVLDATIVNIALPSIQSDLGFSVINAYVPTFGGLLLLGGRAADMFVRRNVFLAGLVVFVLASLGCRAARRS
jgi:MFS family permease